MTQKWSPENQISLNYFEIIEEKKSQKSEIDYPIKKVQSLIDLQLLQLFL